MSAVFKAVESVVESVVEVVEDVVDVVEDVGEAVVDGVKDVGRAIDDYVLQPIKEDPLSFAVTVAAASVGIPPPVTAATITAAKGGDIEDIGRSAVAAYVAPKVGAQVGAAVGQATAGSALQNTLANAAGSGAASATAAAIQGGDVAQSALLGAATGAGGAAARDIARDFDLSPEAVKTAGRVGGALAGGAVTGDVEGALANVIRGETLDAIERELSELTQPPEMDIGFGPGRFTPEYGAEDVEGMSPEEFDRLMADIGIGPEPAPFEPMAPVDYSLTAGGTRPPVREGMGAQGLQVELPELPEAERIGFEPIDYESILAPERGGEGLRVPESPAIEGMGGGTGLTQPTEEGVVSEEGLTPEGEILRQIEEELYPSPDLEAPAQADLGAGAIRVVGEQPTAQRSQTPGVSTRVTGKAIEGILGEKEPLFGGDDDEQRAVWNRRSLRLRNALGI